MYSGIVCLSSKVLTVLGGVVPTLYEEWKMNQKYSGLSRASVRLSQGGDVDGPPPFEKIQVGAPSQKFSQKGKSTCQYSGLLYFSITCISVVARLVTVGSSYCFRVLGELQCLLVITSFHNFTEVHVVT